MAADRTGEIARTEMAPRFPNFRLVEHFPNRGYGGALKAGFEAATKSLIAFIPADRQFKFGEIGLLLDRLTPDRTLVSGWRVNRQDNLIRRMNGRGWNTVVLLLFGRTIHDIDCGFKVFRRDVLKHRDTIGELGIYISNLERGINEVDECYTKLVEALEK